MTFTLRVDESGRFVCTLADESATVTVTASNVPAAATDLLGALDDARVSGYGECFWEESGGEYRWLFRRDPARQDHVTVVVLWSRGTLTGWQHVFRAGCNGPELEAKVRAAFQGIGCPPASATR